ncbi:MAG: DUF692 family protein [Deltaproteobacteria bacterium]|nr:MAG: DUF692 family protein [Deltaproteobacteria bacterium]
MPSAPWLGASLMPADDLRLGLLPALAEGWVDALEWTVDFGFQPVPEWATGLLDAYSSAGRLVGHGVELSLHTLGQAPDEQDWWRQFDACIDHWPLRWLTVHYGWMSAGDWRKGAPLPPPPGVHASALERLERLAARVDIPVGLENLALLLHPDDAARQADELEALLAPIDGVLLLDLHNLWCQAVNLGVDALRLLERYPLDRVVECHVAGGHWDATHPSFRRDTHDDAVPDEVFALVHEARARCPRLQMVTLERMPGTLAEPASFTRDLRRLREVLAEEPPARASAPPRRVSAGSGEDPATASLQSALLAALHGDTPLDEVLRDLRERFPAHAAWLAFDPRAADVARQLVRTWSRPA